MRDHEGSEIWKDVVGYEGFYKVSDLGRVKSLERKLVTSDGKRMTRKEKLLKPGKDKKGYTQVRFYINGDFPIFKTHRLVAKAFLSDYSDDKQINHINGVKSDNRASNLECVNQQKNMDHRANVLNKKPRGIKKHHNRWAAQGTFKGVHLNFGYYETKEEAYRAFYENFIKLRGCAPWDLDIHKTH